nr:RNA-directed DNA polymerase, eukaryota, reverse transcriptase zinc-binding domain protein [Tanacetum cinerariifolium]
GDKNTVWDCGIDKSPGPDGFTFGFYCRYWKLIENDVVDAVTCFFHQGSFPKGGNYSFIILIPKTPNANMVKDYTPISLTGSMYKIISKILANRLVVVLGSLVNEIQSAFVADKQILDGPFILNELVQWCKKKKKQSLVFKVDFKKAGSVIVNGSPMEEFQFYKGLKQVPKKVLHRMESMQSHLFNGAELSSKKSVWVKWKHALASKDKGGLGVSSLFALNRALMFKWVCRFITQGSLLWARVIKELRGYDGKIGQKVKSCYPSLWLDIIHEVEMFNSRGIDLVSLIHSKLGNGANTSFWEVDWRGGSPFKSLFPRGGVELQQFKHIKEKVEGCILVDMMDRWFCALEGSGEFTITSVRKMIDDFMLPEVSSKMRWIKAVPIKVNVHAWKVKIDGLPTRLNISRRDGGILIIWRSPLTKNG